MPDETYSWHLVNIISLLLFIPNNGKVPGCHEHTLQILKMQILGFIRLSASRSPISVLDTSSYCLACPTESS